MLRNGYLRVSVFEGSMCYKDSCTYPYTSSFIYPHMQISIGEVRTQLTEAALSTTY
jgi:hypothetical protein